MKRLLLLLLLVSSAQAALNGGAPFEADYDFGTGYDSDEATLISGAASFHIASNGGTYAAFNTSGLEVSGLTEVCWGAPASCASSPTGDLRIEVNEGGAAGYSFPVETEAEYQSAFSLGFPIDFAQQEELESFELGESFILSSIDGQLDEQTIPAFVGIGSQQDSYGGIVALNDDTILKIKQGTATVQTIASDDPISFSAANGATVSSYTTDFVLLPFEQESEAVWTQPASDAAKEGFQFSTLNNRFQNLGNASGSDTAEIGGEFEDAETLLGEIFSSGIIKVSQATGEVSELLEESEVVRYEEITIRHDGELNWEGTSVLVIRGGAVEGEHNLIGILPWWGYTIIGAAIVLAIVSAALGHPKKGPIDDYAWIGWIAAIAVSFLLFYLWDREMRAVWGTSIMTTDASGVGVGLVIILQLLPYLMVSLLLTLPLRVIGNSIARIAKLGKAARIPTAIMPIFGFLLGATLMKDFLGFLLGLAP